MSDSDEDAAVVTVKGKAKDGRTNYTQYKPKGELRKQTCRKSTGGASPRVVTYGKYKEPTVETPKGNNPKRARLMNSKEKDESESGEDLSEDEDENSDDSVQELTKIKAVNNLEGEEEESDGDVSDDDDHDVDDGDNDEDDVESEEDDPEKVKPKGESKSVEATKSK